jgi:hypothetical protein
MPPSGIAGWWKLDEGSGITAADSSGNNNPGTLSTAPDHGGTIPTWTTGQFGAPALLFDITQASLVDIGNPAVLNLPDWTIMLWFKTPVSFTLEEQSLFGRTAADPLFEQNYLMEYRGAEGPTSFSIGSNADSFFKARSTTIPVTNTWYHIAGSFESSIRTFSIYVNGIAESVNAITGLPSQTGAQTVSIGASNAGLGGFIDGTVYDARIYNRALTAEEVLSIYDASFPASSGAISALRGSHPGSRITPPYNP